MAPQGGGQVGGDGIDHASAKHLLDSIGKIVHNQVKKDANDFGDELKGKLQEAKGMGELVSSPNPCELVKEYYERVNKGGDSDKRQPCKKDGEGNDVDRFSVKQQAEYDNKKMKCSNGKNEGACASFRRLNLCNKNMENMDTNNNDGKAKHNLLAEVCMAAKYEGESITRDYPKYDLKYPSGSGSTTCTMLARSFADIADIVRGRDLYSGNRRKNERETERDKLEGKLKNIFQQIHSGLSKNGAQKHYNDDTPYYYKLREDWWIANRETVWKALTCSDDLKDASYFRATCSDSDRKGSFSQATKQCRCGDGKKPGKGSGDGDVNIVPTYFDYVPQYLRWFEEWAEDFCRKKKKKVENLQKQCRGKYQDADRYCSRNGFDCEKTVNARGKVRMGKGCTDCFFACNPYVEWIDNQRKQFDKQKNKYADEIKKYENGAVGNGTGSGRKKRAASTSNYDGYEKKFYEKLKREYSDVNAFLGLLSKENVCTQITDEKEGKIHFEKVNTGSTGGSVRDASGTNVESQGTFYRSEYCQPCPLCGVKKKSNGVGGNTEWERKDSMNQCPHINLYRPKSDEVGTPINFLYSGEGKEEIEKKLDAFCNQTSGSSGAARGDCGGTNIDSSLCEPWKCYHVNQLLKDQGGEDDHDYEKDVNEGGGLCILETTKGKEKVYKQKTFNNFFYYWVAHMLKDSIHWRTKKLVKCLKNKKTCGNQQCKGNCECFQRWVGQKREEWGKIKTHFNTQNIGALTGCNPIVTLAAVLELEFSNENSTKDAENNVSAEEAQEIKHLRDIIKKKNEEEAASGDGLTCSDSANGQKTLMDKLIDYEEKEAGQCVEKNPDNECKQAPTKPTSGLGRSETLTPGSPQSPALSDGAGEDDDDDEDEEDDDDNDEDEVGAEENDGENVEEEEDQAVKDTDGKGETAKETATTKVTEQDGSPPATQDTVDVCATVAEALKLDTLQAACPTKYGKTAPTSWKCIPSGDNTGSGNDGAICVPPRRRKLYIHDIQSLGVEVGKAPSQEDLLKWFVKSAAVETFFAWHNYKQLHKPQGGGLPLLQLPVASSDDPQSKLQETGEIPNDFLRQMFYTLGDYRDIVVRGGHKTNGVDTNNDKTNIVLEASGSTEDEKQKMKEIQDKIKEHINNGSSSPPTVKTPSQPGDKLKSWWELHGPDIWKGMVCALTYKESENGDKTIVKDEQVYNKFFGTQNGSPVLPTGTAATQNGTYQEKYDYEKVKLEDTSGVKPQTPSSSGDNTLLTNFVKRPPYFRYLEEWGQNFCKERKKRLKQIKDDCYKDGDGKKQKCSCYGEDCQTNLNKPYNILPSLECPGCGRECRKYKKWIEKKKTEYEKQKDRYETERQNAKKNPHITSDNEFCARVNTCSKAGDFLQKLGPCSKKDDDSAQDEIKFDDENKDKTFGHETYCKPCSKFTVKCKENNHCDNSKEQECQSKTHIEANDIKNEGDSIGNVGMLVSDKNGGGFEGVGLEDCNGKGIFESITKDEWTCEKVCGYVVCKPKKVNGETTSGKKNDQIITIRALVTHWVHNFLEDYKKIKHKISDCMKNGKEYPCIKKCVEQWIQKKRTEWKEIKERFNDQYKSNGSDDDNVRSVLETFLLQIGAANANHDGKKLIKLSQFDTSCGCSASANVQNDSNQDTIECMLDRLQQKIEECKRKPGENSVQNIGQQQENCDKNPPPELDEEDLTLEEENTVEAPKICKDVIKAPTEPEKEDGCEPAPTAPSKEPGSTPSAGEKPAQDTKDNPPEEKAPAPAPESPAQPTPLPQPSDNTSDILATTIPFGIALALGSIAFLFLKKKTKSSVGNLFQILQIPKGDYDIPTKLSPNRYIPYTSGKYRGKRYIYLEGDSGTDSGYTDHYSDITSSESEYEEMDVNDIYVPGSPKYKTLIEVVLEPSGNNTTASGKNTTASGKNTPSDTQNDIQNDGIPSSKITDNEWNTLKHDFISNMLQSEQPKDVPNDYSSGDIPFNTQPNTLYFDNNQEKPFIMSIHDRNLYTGEEYNYNVNMSTNIMDDPKHVSNNVYSGIDLINDSLNSNNVDIYDEVLKRKENELFGTEHHPKRTTTNHFATPTRDDPIHNQLELFHKWLDRHRDMCEQWNNKEEVLNKLKELWENETHSGNTHPSDSNKTLNTDVSIQIDMDNPKPINQFTNMDTILEDLDKYNEPFYDIYEDDVYYDVNDHDTSTVDSNNMDVPSKVQIEMDVNTKLVKEKYPIADVWDI